MTERKITKYEPRNTHLLDYIPGTSQNYRRYTICFKVPRYQTHGLMTDWSDANQEGNINLVLPTHLQNLRCIAFTCYTLTTKSRCSVETGP